MIEAVFSVDINAPAGRVWDEITRGGGPNRPMFGTYVFGDFAVGSVLTYLARQDTHGGSAKGRSQAPGGLVAPGASDGAGLVGGAPGVDFGACLWAKSLHFAARFSRV